MKNLLKAPVALAVLVGAAFTSCVTGPDVYFEVAQPANVKAQTNFPEHLQGTYAFEEDYKESETMEVGPDYYTTDETKTGELVLEDLSEEAIKKVFEEQNMKLEYVDYEIKGDTLAYKATMPRKEYLSDQQVLKKYKGYYYISRREDRGWSVIVFKDLGEGKVAVGYANPFRKRASDEYESFGEAPSAANEEEMIAHYKNMVPFVPIGDSEDFAINPTKKEFHQLVKADYFEIIGIARKLK